MEELTTFDKSLLNILQGGLPVCSHPFQVIGEELGTDEQTVLARVRALKEAGYVRRIGTFFNSARLGYKGTLVALQVGLLQSLVHAEHAVPGGGRAHSRHHRGAAGRRVAAQPQSQQEV